MSVLKHVTRDEWEAAPVDQRFIEDGEYYVPFTIQDHPWAIYIRAREDAIKWMAADGEPPERIVRALHCDLGDVLGVLHAGKAAR